MPLFQRRPPIQVLRAPVEQRVRHACLATIAVVIWGLIVHLREPQFSWSWAYLVDLAILGGLIYCYSRRSRIAAIALPGYFVAVSLYQLVGLHQGVGYFQLAILGWFLVRGSGAIFESHRPAPTTPTPSVPNAG